MKKLIFLLAFALLPSLAQAQVLKFVGAGGRVEFANVCPPGTKAENTGIRNNPGAAPASQQKTLPSAQRRRRCPPCLRGRFMIVAAPRSAILVEQRGARFTLLIGYFFVLLGFLTMLLLSVSYRAGSGSETAPLNQAS